MVFDGTHSVCHRCWQSAENGERRHSNPAVPEEVPEAAPEAAPEVAPEAAPEPAPDAVPQAQFEVEDYTRAPNTSRHCIFNHCQNTTRHRIPTTIKTHIFCEYKLYIPNSARVCTEHLESNAWNELPQSCNTTHDFNTYHFTDICDMLRMALQRGPRLDFNTRGALTNEEMHFWTGRKCEEFDSILEETPTLNEMCREPRTALGVYLTKLRTGESDERLATLFNMSRRKVERLLVIVRECLNSHYVGLHLGVDHIDRNQLLERNLSIPKSLFGNENNDKLILICDGTYHHKSVSTYRIYINKSSNFLFQRLSYSLHKFQNLLKPFLVVCTDG